MKLKGATHCPLCVQIAEIQQKQHKRASSVSSSENFSSSRSDSWRQHQHHCGIPMRLLDPKRDPKRRASSWLVTRKTSQDSNLSSSRYDVCRSRGPGLLRDGGGETRFSPSQVPC